MLHLTKLAVGVRDLDHLHKLQVGRVETDPPLRHRTRNSPRRRAEVIDGGSLYWVISGSMLARQRILDIIEDRWEDGTTCCGLILDDALVPLAGRPPRPCGSRRGHVTAGAAAGAAGPLPALTGAGASVSIMPHLWR